MDVKMLLASAVSVFTEQKDINLVIEGAGRETRTHPNASCKAAMTANPMKIANSCFRLLCSLSFS